MRQDDDQRKSIVQQDMQQSTFFLRRVIEGQGGIALSYVGPHCHRHPRGDSIWWVLTEHTKKTVQLVVRGMRRPAQLEEPKQSLGHTGHWRADPSEGEGVSRSRPRPQGACETRVCTQVVDESADGQRQRRSWTRPLKFCRSRAG